MGHAEHFIQKMTRVFEQHGHSFTFTQNTPGYSFTHDEKRTIPAGKYTVIEPDTRDNSRVIVINSKTYDMYAVQKRLIPHD
jgi:hypothetical protein